ncbi:major capsid protein, HK97 family protein [Oceanicola granulosus HTCC2516]|uniref:Major capsid protein, HK97 family protein n=1 Tax=Oceanicola granulosus (strain ATCC BAA-861 / DSM 15982 / KCTC 12143 / HTCC2516) TaxID=314256 RepID=Q2CEB4_OCEGH|nr:phage major capsid protein [Oceanicola granulosus]EAR51083.1 major capsid protein, HK97 family protein [Oceanicola granulosus HTCC2516]
MSDTDDLTQAIRDFSSDLGTFRDDIHTRLQEQETRMTQIDRKSLSAAARPALSAAAEGPAPHAKAFEAYLRSGDDDALRGLELEGKAISTVAGDGGYLVDPQTSETVASVLSTTASLRAVASVVQVNATSYDVLIDHSEAGAGWGSESGSVGETATPALDRISIPLYELNAMPKASQRLLDDSAFDVEGWLAERIAAKFARAEAEAFVTGDGTDKPKGFLTYPQIDNASWSWGSIGTIPTGSDGAFSTNDSGNAMINLVYAVSAEYRAGGSFVMNSRTASEVRKLKDSDGRFLWSDGFVNGEPARLLGYKVLIAEDMPDIASGTTAIAFGDFSAGYTVAERPDLRVLRDPFSAKPHVLFYATKRVGGGVSDYAAIKLLKFSVS